MMTAKITQIPAFMALTQMRVMSLLFLSGALPAAVAARVAHRSHAVRSDYARRLPAAARGLYPPDRLARRQSVSPAARAAPSRSKFSDKNQQRCSEI
jgi:hypothetical protein